eukprot:TRINITY_DN1459_c0_g1_i1.p1 TRINITY_DN1459_c0_g1~~TRINITY_DN1459_c0_g1_i1.p1  ORF type:complete len:426 (-),score=98.78 TRINITY_DN1459_c0_g1_i1:439-1716(-)
MAWSTTTVVLVSLIACIAVVAGDIIGSHGTEMKDAKGALLLGSLGLLGTESVWPSFCLGGTCLLLWRLLRSAGTEGSKNLKGSKEKAELPRPIAETPADYQDFQPEVREVSPRRRRKEFEGCFMCSFFEGWLLPAEPAEHVAPSLPEASDSQSSEAEKMAFEALRGRLSDLLGPPGHSGRAPCDAAAATVARFGGDRSCLYRFLRAKQLDVDAAEKKLRKTIAWREEVNANEIQQDREALRIFDLMKPHWPEKIVSTTKKGNPVSYFDLAAAVQTCQLDIWTEANVQSFYVSWMERSLQLQREGRDRYGALGAGNNMPASVVVYNLKDLRLSHVMNCVSGLKAFVKILGIIEEHYPENLHKAIITNVPCVFYRGVWPLVQKGLDANTLSNIHLSEGDGQELLEEVLDISQAEAKSLLENVLRDGA